MSKKILVISGVAVILGVYILHTASSHTQILVEKVSGKWDPSFGKTVSYRNHDYSITKSGDVVRLEDNQIITNDITKRDILALIFFYAETVRDPIFYSPQLNTQNWRQAIASLKKSRSQYFDSMRMAKAQTLFEKKALNKITQYPNAIFPLPFLEKFVDVVEAQVTFLDNPSDRNARDLIRLQKSAQREYYRSASKFLRVTDFVENILKPGVFLSLGSAVDMKLIVSDARLLVENARKIKMEIDEREHCLTLGLCSEFDAVHEHKPQVEKVTRVTIQPSPYKIPIELITPPDTIITAGPYSITSSCWGRTNNREPRQLPMYLFISKYKGLPAALPMLADENFYWDVRITGYPSDIAKAEKGITINDQAATNPYMCNDNSYFPNTLTLFSLQELVQKDGIVVDSESLLTQTDPISDQIFNTLIEDYNLSSSPKALERKHIISNKLLGYDFTLGKLVEMIDAYTAITTINNTPFPIPTILGYRNHYSLLYMPFAESVWRIDENLKLLLPDKYPNKTRYSSWDELIQTPDFNPYKFRVWDTHINTEILHDIEVQKHAFPLLLFSEIGNYK